MGFTPCRRLLAPGLLLRTQPLPHSNGSLTLCPSLNLGVTASLGIKLPLPHLHCPPYRTHALLPGTTLFPESRRSPESQTAVVSCICPAPQLPGRPGETLRANCSLESATPASLARCFHPALASVSPSVKWAPRQHHFTGGGRLS